MNENYIYPSSQGSIDSLCGAYSIVNSMVWLYGRKINRRKLFNEVLKVYSNKWDLIDWVIDGVDCYEMSYLIKKVLLSGRYAKKYPVNVVRPFYKSRRLKIEDIFDEIEIFMNLYPISSRIVLIANHEHWTLISNIDSNHVYYFDSCSLQHSRRSSFSIKSKEARYKIIQDEIYFIYKDELIF